MSVPKIDEIDRAKKKRQPISSDPPKLMKFNVFLKKTRKNGCPPRP